MLAETYQLQEGKGDGEAAVSCMPKLRVKSDGPIGTSAIGPLGAPHVLHTQVLPHVDSYQNSITLSISCKLVASLGNFSTHAVALGRSAIDPLMSRKELPKPNYACICSFCIITMPKDCKVTLEWSFWGRVVIQTAAEAVSS
jgi:hypothetical protein